MDRRDELDDDQELEHDHSEDRLPWKARDCYEDDYDDESWNNDDDKSEFDYDLDFWDDMWNGGIPWEDPYDEWECENDDDDEEPSHLAWSHKEERVFRHTKNRGRAGDSSRRFREADRYHKSTCFTKPHQAGIQRNRVRSCPKHYLQSDLGVRTRYVLRSDGAYWVTSLSLEHTDEASTPRWNDLYVIPTAGKRHLPYKYNWNAKSDARALIAKLQARRNL
jgi:hypothetical protein